MGTSCKTVMALGAFAVITLLVACGGGTTAASRTTAPPGADACGVVGPDPECHTLVSGGITRAYLLHVPVNFQPGTGALVIGLHGSAGSGALFRDTSQLSAKADAAGFAIAYPYAL
ncbi:MAG TPA: hypothetical protein VEW69_08295, partial [Alphaproteobacteria bacterium]|nr:hypothetical protein [Alphaproteobacteria bacterium]